jgi:hypothetical protein
MLPYKTKEEEDYGQKSGNEHCGKEKFPGKCDEEHAKRIDEKY